MEGAPNEEYGSEEEYASDLSMHMDNNSSDDECAPPTSSGSPGQLGALKRPLYSSCSADELLPRVQQLVAAVVTSELLSLDEDEALLLLRALNWDQRRLEEQYFEDQDALRSKCCVSAGPDPPPLPGGILPGSVLSCSVTLDDTTYADADACACGHWFSAAAWRGRLGAAVQSVEHALTVTCPADGCRELCRPRLMRRHLDGPQLARYWEFVSRAFAESSRVARWCPAPGCRFIVLARDDGNAAGAADVACPDGHAFCFACREPPHRPASCAEVARWRAEEKAEGGNAQWLVANTKPCPNARCRRAIEKNQGCNHMRCGGNLYSSVAPPPGLGCGTDFCWVCMQLWAGHDGDPFRCSRAAAAAAGASSAADAARGELARFAFAAERHGGLLRDAAFADGRREAVAAQQAALAARHGAGLADVDFLRRATDVGVRGRRAAAWAHVHGYYAPAAGGYRALFEDSRCQLEAHLEALQGLVESETIRRVEDGTFEAPASFLRAHAAAAAGRGVSAAAAPAAPAAAAAAAAAAAGPAAPALPAAASLAAAASVPAASTRSSGPDAGLPLPLATVAAAAAAARTVAAMSRWRQAATNLLGATDHYVTQLLEAVEEGFGFGGT